MMSINLSVLLLLITQMSVGQMPVASTVMSREELARAAYPKLSCAAQIGYHSHGTDDEEECFEPSARRISTQASTRSSNKLTLRCAIEACKKTGDRLPLHCPNAGLSFSEEAGTVFNTVTNSRPEFTCTWICAHRTRPEWRERHGPWALLAIDGSPIVLPPLRTGEQTDDQKR